MRKLSLVALAHEQVEIAEDGSIHRGARTGSQLAEHETSGEATPHVPRGRARRAAGDGDQAG